MDTSIVVKNFKKNNINVTVLEDSDELLHFLKKNIPAHSVVGVGDSVTLETTGVYDFLRRETYTFLDKYDKRLTKEEKRNLYLRACLKLVEMFFKRGFRISRIVPFFEVTKPKERCIKLI